MFLVKFFEKKEMINNALNKRNTYFVVYFIEIPKNDLFQITKCLSTMTSAENSKIDLFYTYIFLLVGLTFYEYKQFGKSRQTCKKPNLLNKQFI